MTLPRASSLATRGLRLLPQTEGRCLYNSTFRVARLASTNLTITTLYKHTISSIRPFSQSSSLHRTQGNRPPVKNATKSTPFPDHENPLDFSALLDSYNHSDTHYKGQLRDVLNGWRFSPDVLGALMVPVKSPEDGTVLSHPLSELAQVVPRSGRIISLLVNEREYIKPIMSVIQSNKAFNQQPQRSEDNELELLIKIQMERKEELVRRVRILCQGWRDSIRVARRKHEKYWKDWKKEKLVLKDVMKKAEQEIQKIQDKKMKEIDEEEAKTNKQLDRTWQ